MTESTIYTVGHSNHATEYFFELGAKHSLQVLVDVRSSPYSKYADQYNKREFEYAARAAGLIYLYLGAELGGQPKDQHYYDAEGFVRYDRIAASPAFKAGISRLLDGLAKGYRIALVCGEEDPTECHRRRLIAPALAAKGVRVVHIRGDGALVTEQELAAIQGPRTAQLSLFADEELEPDSASKLSPPEDGPQSAREILRRVFGFKDFLGEQERIIAHVAAGGDAVVLMPTGSGKSLCYQLPALLRPGVAVVISPLIALMRDQVQALQQNGVRAASLHSGLSAAQARQVETDVLQERLDLIYVAPERLVQERFLDLLLRSRLALFAIDEAHCVSQWGHDFRPEYTQLKLLAERFPEVPRLALTATADGPTRRDIISHLGLQGASVFSTGYDRPNIRYSVVPRTDPRGQLLAFITERYRGASGIVYRMTRKKVESLADYLAKRGVRALPYHAGMTQETRDANQARFTHEDGIVMVATVAFGMGIDKPDVRFVAHLDLPKSLEAYYQETGRSGRDGLPAEAWMTYGLADVVALRRIMELGGPPEGADMVAYEHHKRVEQLKLNGILGYCETTACRRQVLLRYFGDTMDQPCGNCDACLNPATTWDATDAAQKALSCIYRTGQRFGPAYLSRVLRGEDDERVRSNGHNRLKTFGVGRDLDNATWLSIYRQLVAAGDAALDMNAWGGLKLTGASWEILRGERTVALRRDAAVTQSKASASKKGAKKTDDRDGQLPTEEARELFEALRALRRELAAARSAALYVIATDRTLLDLVRFRPQDMDGLARIYGLGESKRANYGARILELLAEHELAFGRPDDLPELPDAPVRPTTKELGPATETETTSLDLFREHGSVEAVAAARELKPSTIMGHLAQAVARGEITAREVALLPASEYDCVEDTVRTFNAEEIPELGRIFEALEKKYPYDILRCIRVELARAACLAAGKSEST